MEDNLIMVCYLMTRGRANYILRVYENDTFDLLYSCTQPTQESEVPRERFDFAEIEKIKVGEIKDWVSGIIGVN